MAVTCGTCFRHCVLEEGQAGFCRARGNQGGRIVPLACSRGRAVLSALALDPIEKKPLARFMPGKMILSAGGWGCNMRCAFCQNYGISQRTQPEEEKGESLSLSPDELAVRALTLRGRGNIGLAYTYNEPLVTWEFVRDCARLVREAGMKNVIVTNGCVTPKVLEEVLPFTDAVNIDLKCFSAASYRALGGDFDAVMDAIRLCHDYGGGSCHVELTTLVVPGFNDGEDEMAEEVAWIASLDRDIPLHLTRFFPRWQMTDRPPTPVDTLLRLARLARRELSCVLVGNV